MFTLAARDKDGVSYREALEGLLARAKTPEQAAKRAAELALPPLPAAGRYLWQQYLRISRRRGHNGWSPMPITWLDIDAFQRVTGFRFAPWEIEVVEQLDQLELAAVARAQEGSPPAP